MAGVDITTVKELLGHKALTMPLRYAHLTPSHKVKAVDILDRAINNKESVQDDIALKVISKLRSTPNRLQV